jgi:hypothetical protein
MIFGSILPVLTYKTFDEALVKISARPHPLAAFIFSRDMAAIDRFVGELSFGGGAVINSRFLRFRNEFIGDGFVDVSVARRGAPLSAPGGRLKCRTECLSETLGFRLPAALSFALAYTLAMWSRKATAT